MKYLLLLLFFCVMIPESIAQEASVLINGVNRKFARVKDYQADAVIDTRISFLKILPQKAKILYSKPGKFKVRAEGIAILPKQDFDQLFELLADPSKYNAFVTGTDEQNQEMLVVVQVIPVSDTSDLVLAKLWIDPANDLIIRSQLTTRSNGTVLIAYKYGRHAAFALPDRILFTVELKKFKIPRAVSAEINAGSSAGKTDKEQKTGQIIISLENYRINQGIDPAEFK
jgi:hypothetical protein